MLEGYFDKIYYRFFKEEGSFANVFAIHGLGGHSIWFDNAARIFNKNKISFFSFDLPGFGQSKYPKGAISSYKIWINETQETLKRFLVSFNINKPVFILGHSMGALLAALLSENVITKGWILSVPAFEGNPKTWPLAGFFLPVLFKSLFKPKENVDVPFGPELITKNTKTQLMVKQDKLRVFNLNADVYKHVYFLTLKAKQKVSLIKEPVIMLQAGKDMVCSNAFMRQTFTQIKSKDKVIKVYENSYHDLFIEDELPQIVDDISCWVKDKCLV